MAKSTLLPGYKGLGGTAKQVLNEKTGEILSRRKYVQEVKRVAQLGKKTTNEELAKFNLAVEKEISLARPARKRTSARKLTDAVRVDVIKARAEEKERIANIRAGEKESNKINRRIENAKKRKIHVKKIRNQLLKPGNMGARIAFNDYDDYVDLYAQGKANKNVVFYGLGVEGVDQRTGQQLTATVFTMRTFDRVIQEDDFDDAMSDWLETKPYFIFTNYFMHLAFDKNYAMQKRDDYKKRNR